MNRRKSKTVLVALAAMVVAIVVSHIDFSAYSTGGIAEELADLISIYARLREQRAPEAEWEAFARDARRRTASILTDMDSPSSLCNAEDRSLYQLARYALPRAIESRGRTPPADLEQWLRKPRHRLQAAQSARHQNARQGVFDNGIDWITVAIVVFDLALLVGMGYMFLKPYAGRAQQAPLAEGKEALLRKLDREIAQDPKSARHRGIRAKLLIEMGRREDALADIDWIIDTEPHGADLITWHELRDSLTQEHTEKENPEQQGPTM
ncbi:MAG: hypothetical protein NTW96_24450 [Planctomycetia bacterium]|nr:hypothetical protein [Planctomycetia bacterium]